MCGFFFSNNAEFIPNLSDLNPRGPDETNTLSHEFGFFHHSRLITKFNCVKQPAINNFGILLYNGTEYSLKDSDTNYILDNFSDNIDNNLQFLKSLRGDYAICFVSEKYIFLAKDYFSTKPLFFNIDKHVVVASTELAIKSLSLNPYSIPANSLYVICRQTLQLYQKLTIYEFNLQQYENSYDKVFESFEKSTLQKHVDNSFLSLSSGYDTGTVAACLHKYNKNFNVITYPDYENKKILKERSKFINGKKIILTELQVRKNEHLLTKLPYYDVLEKESCIWRITYSSALFAFNNKWNVNLTGNGGDDIFSDYSNVGKRLEWRSAFSGVFPKDLNTIWPYIMKSNGSTFMHVPPVDYINGLFGIDTRHPLLDINLLQNFLNLKVELKNNVYKNWMHFYMREANFPFKYEKVSIGGYSAAVPIL